MSRSHRQHSVHSRVLILAIIAVFLTLGGSRCAVAATPQQVEEAIQKGKDYLYSTMKNGTWEHMATAPLIPNNASGSASFSNDSTQWGMPTATATYALLAAGESPQDPRLKSAIDFLKKADIHGIYALSMRCQVWSLLPPSADVQQAIHRDLYRLLSGSLKRQQNGGFFDFTCPPLNRMQINHELTGYGMMGMKALADAGAEIPDDFWISDDRTWRAEQNNDGGWSYTGLGGASKDPSVESASGAGVMSLFITEEFLRSNSGLNCAGNFKDVNRARGLQFISNLKLSERTELHWLYMLQHIASASALKYFGAMDWYAVMSDLLVRTQGKDGSWVDVIDLTPQWSDHIVGTGYCVAILSSSRAPLMASKLIYDVAGAGGPDQAGNWNQRPRDVANITSWVGRQMERELNWQITDLKSPAVELLDAPMLYISGNETLTFKPEEIEKLQWYIHQGGLIVGNADCGSSKFADSFRKLGAQLFPESEFRVLPPSHSILQGQQFLIDKKHGALTVEGLSNGVRELMILFDTSDPGKAWQQRATAGKETAFKVMADVYQYAAGLTSVFNKGEGYFVQADPTAKTSRKISVARLRHDGTWDPEPGGWVRMANILRNGHQVDLDVAPVEAGGGKLDPGKFKVAYLTAVGKFSLGQPARDEIKSYVNDGGTLIVEAAGADADAVNSLTKELVSIFGSPGETVANTDAVFTSPVKVGKPQYRIAAQTALSSGSGPHLTCISIKDRQAVYFSTGDLSLGLVGMPTDSVVGYAPETATNLVTNMILRAATTKGK